MWSAMKNASIEDFYKGSNADLMSVLNASQNAAERISGLFLELLERQFPIESSHQRLTLRTAKDYADRQIGPYPKYLYLRFR